MFEKPCKSGKCDQILFSKPNTKKIESINDFEKIENLKVENQNVRFTESRKSKSSNY